MRAKDKDIYLGHSSYLGYNTTFKEYKSQLEHDLRQLQRRNYNRKEEKCKTDVKYRQPSIYSLYNPFLKVVLTQSPSQYKVWVLGNIPKQKTKEKDMKGKIMPLAVFKTFCWRFLIAVLCSCSCHCLVVSFYRCYYSHICYRMNVFAFVPHQNNPLVCFPFEGEPEPEPPPPIQLAMHMICMCSDFSQCICAREAEMYWNEKFPFLVPTSEVKQTPIKQAHDANPTVKREKTLEKEEDWKV